MLTLDLPWPPSVNHYWRRSKTGGNWYVSDEGKAFRAEVQARVLEHYRAKPKSLIDRLSIVVHLYPPDRRKSDIDNRCKGLLDALQAAGVYEDDCQIDRLTMERFGRVEGGKCIVTIAPIYGPLQYGPKDGWRAIL